MKTKEEIKKEFDALMEDVNTLNKSTDDFKEMFHLFYIGGYVDSEGTRGSCSMMGVNHVLSKLSGSEETVDDFMKIALVGKITSIRGGFFND